MSDATTVVKWMSAHGLEHRIQVKQIPGSANWSILKDVREPEGEWDRVWADEATTKPEFTAAEGNA